MPVSLKEPVSVQLVLGTQWGDEGKGKVVDLIGAYVDIVARYQGGPNAGHTVEFDGETFILHHIPSGILRPHTKCYVGNGVVINPESMMAEITTLEEKGIKVVGRLSISQCAHLILPYHLLVDKATEKGEARRQIGTTGRGIGPAYADKMNRVGIRVGDLLHEDTLRENVSQNIRYKNTVLEKVYGLSRIDEKDVWESLAVFRDKISACITDVTWRLHQDMQEKRKILLEGAQGMLLDIDFGTYPFVTSSNTTVGGVCTGLGMHPKSIDRVIGVIKAYTTRVGNGPFPTELTGDLGEKVREMGGEYGATTGRPRRCGWFDGMIARYAAMVNGLDSLAVTKLDVLDGLEEIKLCTGYRHPELGELDHFPTDGYLLEEVEPVYETMPGWQEPLKDIRSIDRLPRKAKDYLDRMEEIVGVPIGAVSVGAGRDQVIWV